MYRYLLVQPNGDCTIFYVKACADLFRQIQGTGIVKEIYVGPEL